MISLETGVRHVEPYPVSVFDNVLAGDVYERLVSGFPARLNTTRRSESGKYNKDCLASRHHKESFNEFMRGSPEWYELYRYINKQFPSMVERALDMDVDSFGSRRVVFEFSSLPAKGGGLLPHPDAVKKIATAVMFCEPDWQSEWGGAFEVLKHKTDPTGDFDDRRARWDECETVLAVDVVPNRMLFMQRTPWSLHGVRPLDSPRPRRTITVNLVCKNAKR